LWFIEIVVYSPHRHDDPVRPVIQFISQLIHRFFGQEYPEQGFKILLPPGENGASPAFFSEESKKIPLT
jgi:hypothetical protein